MLISYQILLPEEAKKGNDGRLLLSSCKWGDRDLQGLLAAVDLGHDHLEGTRTGIEPRALFVQRPGHEVERDVRGRDLDVVDLGRGLGVVGGRRPDQHPVMVPRTGRSA